MNKREAKHQLTNWWHEQVELDIDMVVPKSIEYGSRDLTEMGRTLVRMMDLPKDANVDDAFCTEVGIWFYALGKMARWTAAIERGEPVSQDTLTDLGVYTMMGRRVQEVGAWPFPAKEDEPSTTININQPIGSPFPVHRGGPPTDRPRPIRDNPQA